MEEEEDTQQAVASLIKGQDLLPYHHVQENKELQPMPPEEYQQINSLNQLPLPVLAAIIKLRLLDHLLIEYHLDFHPLAT